MLLSACGGAGGASTTATGAPEGWPELLLVGEGHGPSLYNGPDATAAAIGYIAEGAQVRIVGPVQGDRIPVRIDGPFKVRAWLPLARLAGRVQRRGKLRGAPISLGVNDLVGVRGAAEGARMIVEARPRFGRTPEPAVGPFEGTFPARGVGPAEVAIPTPASAPAADATATPTTPPAPAAAAPPAATSPERARLPSGRAVELYNRPRGQVVATIPPLERGLAVEVARRRGEWTAIRAGIGPFLVGWVRGPLETPDASDLVDDVGPARAPTAAPHRGPPRMLENDAAMPLWRVRSRTRVRFDGVTIGRLADRGWAREMRRTPDGEVDVFVAVDDEVAVRGMVRARDLEPVEAGAIPATPEAGATAQPPADAPLSDVTTAAPAAE
jgi:hypothetical protein